MSDRLELWDVSEQSLWSYRWISLIFGCKYFNRRRLADSLVESVDGTSYFVTRIKQPAENLNIYDTILCLHVVLLMSRLYYHLLVRSILSLVNNFQEILKKKKKKCR